MSPGHISARSWMHSQKHWVTGTKPSGMYSGSGSNSWRIPTRTTSCGRHQPDCMQCMSVLHTIPCALAIYLPSVHTFGSVGLITFRSHVYAPSRSAMPRGGPAEIHPPHSHGVEEVPSRPPAVHCRSVKHTACVYHICAVFYLHHTHT